jgi:hypothetical protein
MVVSSFEQRPPGGGGAASISIHLLSLEKKREAGSNTYI